MIDWKKQRAPFPMFKLDGVDSDGETLSIGYNTLAEAREAARKIAGWGGKVNAVIELEVDHRNIGVRVTTHPVEAER